MKPKSWTMMRPSIPGSAPLIRNSWPDGVTNVSEPARQLRAISRAAKRNAAGAPTSAGSLPKALGEAARAASDGSCAKVMVATLDFHTCNTAFGIE